MRPGRRWPVRASRTEPPVWLAVAMTVAAPLGAVLASAVLFLAMGYPARQTLHAFFLAPLETVNGWSELALRAAPLITIGLGLVACFRANVWNIGADGQFTLGAIGAGCVALGFGPDGSRFALPLMMSAAILAGMAWAAVPALLRTSCGASETLTSLMLTYVAGLVLTALVFGPLKDPQGFNFPQSRLFADNELLPIVIPGTRVTAGTLASLLLPLPVWLLLERTVSGFAIRTFGVAPPAARFAGFSERRTIWLVMLASGGLAGLAGCLEVAGPIGQLIPSVSPGYGFSAIIVAFLARLHPIGVVPAGLLVALSIVGGDLAQVAVGLPRGASAVVQAMLLFFPLAADFFARGHAGSAAA